MIDSGNIQEQLGRLFIFEQRGGHIRIETPFLYPDRDVVDLYLLVENNTLSDLGEAHGYLATHLIEEPDAKNQRALIDEIALTYDISYTQGAFSLRVQDAASLAQGIIQLASACLAFVYAVSAQLGLSLLKGG